MVKFEQDNIRKKSLGASTTLFGRVSFGKSLIKSFKLFKQLGHKLFLWILNLFKLKYGPLSCLNLEPLCVTLKTVPKLAK